MRYKHNDGGRLIAGFKGHARDCAIRAIAIAACLPYRDTYAKLKLLTIETSGGLDRSVRDGGDNSSLP